MFHLLKEYRLVEIRLGMVVIPETEAWEKKVQQTKEQLQAAEASHDSQAIQQARQQHAEAVQEHERSKNECRRLTRIAVDMGIKIAALRP
jgi:aspartate/methionine/tyrosine aminotransferase